MNTRYSIQAITGVILAGGRAERMGGQDKGLIPLNGRPLVAHAVEKLAPQVSHLLINANRNFEAYRDLVDHVIQDDVGEFFGPLAGMLAAMTSASTQYILTVPCDSPLLPTDYAARMVRALMENQAELCVAHDGNRLQPVFALLDCALSDSLQAYLAAGDRKIDRWFAQQWMATADFSDRLEMFHNINTPEELATLEQILIDS